MIATLIVCERPRASVRNTMRPDRNLTEPSRTSERGPRDKRKLAVSSGFSEADEGTQTLDLLHGKPCRRSQRATTDDYDWKQPCGFERAHLLEPACLCE
jgi:hypothetical protein